MKTDFMSPAGLSEALGLRAAHPDALPVAGGTDVMVGVNFGHLRPPALLDLTRVPELRELTRSDGSVFLGAGVTYQRVIAELADLVPLVQASRTVGSPQIRRRGTVGGNLGTASPAGDSLPVLAAYDAEIEVGSAARGRRRLPWQEFLLGPKQTALQPDELIVGAHFTVPRGPGSFSKVGRRNAMVIAIVGICLQLDLDARRVRLAVGSAGPTVFRATAAEAFAAAALDEAGLWDDPSKPLPEAIGLEFADRVAAAASPIDDVRGSSIYRLHAAGVLARRCLRWALAEAA